MGEPAYQGKMKKVSFFLAAGALLIAGCKSGDTSTASTAPAATNPPVTTPPTSTAPATASGDAKGYAAVQAVFTKSCVGCHGAGRPKGGISLTDHDSVMKGGKEGPIVVAGDPAGSLIIKALRGQPGARKMPPGAPLAEDQIKTVEAWIKDGAKA